MLLDLDTAFAEIAEGLEFNLPETLPVERAHAGIAKTVVTAFVFAGIVVFARWMFEDS